MGQTHTSGSQSRLSTSKGGTIDWSIVSASSATVLLALMGEQGGGSAELACILGCA